MGRIRKNRKKFRDWSLRATFVFDTLLAFALATLACSLCVVGIDNIRMETIGIDYWKRYQEFEVPVGGGYVAWSDGGGLHYRILDAAGNEVALAEADGVTARVVLSYVGELADEAEQLNTPNLITIVPIMNSEQRTLSMLLTAANLLSFPVCYGGGAALCAALFYRKKLKGPIALLDMASRKIAAEDLDFAVRWDRKDEMGALCDSFEQMRGALAENNRAMWRQMEERKRLNAAFAHDLRTPLTVLNGYAGMLLNELKAGGGNPEEMAQEVRVMQAHIRRLEEYVEAMSSLRRLEDQQVRRVRAPLTELCARLKSELDILLPGKRTALHMPDGGETLDVDMERVMQVYENLLANAARFAAARVDVTVETDGDALSITVEDDGPGFTPEGLQKATEPFYRAEGPDVKGHLGLGLNICRVLCEGCGGGLAIQNGEEGGARVRAWFGM